MRHEETRNRSRWIIRVMEWDDARARYPNIWHEGMPCQILVFERVAGRLRLGDLIAIYYPASQRHSERGECFVGIARVAGLRRAYDAEHAWVDLETAHRFDPPLKADEEPKRVFMSCDPGWPESDVAMFRKVFDAAVAAGWKPTDEERAIAGSVPGGGTASADTGKRSKREPPRDVESVPSPSASASTTHTEPIASGPSAEPPKSRTSSAASPEATPKPRDIPAPTVGTVSEDARLFAGVDYSGDMRDPRNATWLAVLELHGDRLNVARLDATGRGGLQAYLRDPDSWFTRIEAIGLDFPFGLPKPFAEKLLGEPFPDEGWWALAKRFEKLSRPDYLVQLQEFRDEHGEMKRLTDERARAFSPLHRVNPDLGPMTFHGIRMIAEDRSRFAVRPFESAQGKLLLEVYPGGVIKQLDLSRGNGGERKETIAAALSGLATLPVDIDERFRRDCLRHRDALDAVIAARAAAMAVTTGEADLKPDELAPGEGERVRCEGWIYGNRL